jgi:hypothetical protein
MIFLEPNYHIIACFGNFWWAKPIYIYIYIYIYIKKKKNIGVVMSLQSVHAPFTKISTKSDIKVRTLTSFVKFFHYSSWGAFHPSPPLTPKSVHHASGSISYLFINLFFFLST